MLRLHLPGFSWHSFVWIGLAKEALSKRGCSGITTVTVLEVGPEVGPAAGPEIVPSEFKLEPQGGAKPQLANFNLKPLNSFSHFVNRALISPTFNVSLGPTDCIRAGVFV